MTWLLLEVGCAECGNEPLAEVIGHYDDAEAGKCDGIEGERWVEHPQGWIQQHGSGAMLLVDTSAKPSAARGIGQPW